jgi:hypothetical protein
MQQHLQTPEQALLNKHWETVNRHAWRLRKITGGALRLALLLSVPENLRQEVEQRVLFLQRKHSKESVP